MVTAPTSQSALFQPLRIGSTPLSHRIVMAPLTRFRADDNHVPTSMQTTYYSQRASVPGTLLITEGTLISPRAAGQANAPGIWNAEQVAAWRRVTEAVHARGSYVFLQLWALGRAASKSIIEKEVGEGAYASSSAVPMAEGADVPRELSEEEIWRFIGEYGDAARRAVKEAGFDGVEIHGANGYLIDQFTQDTANRRTDAWGGSVENRARFGIEVAKAVIKAVGPERVGFRLSPFNTFQGMRMKDPVPQFTYLTEELNKLDLAYLHLTENWREGLVAKESPDRLKFAVEAWGDTKPIVFAGGFQPASAKERVDVKLKGKNVAIAFGRSFISNPDLPFRILNDMALQAADMSTFYKAKSAEGYTDYAFSKEFKAQQAGESNSN